MIHRSGRDQRGGDPNTQQSNPQLTYLLPQDSARIVGSKLSECYNLSLILARYVPKEVVANSDIQNERNAKWRDRWLKEQCRRFDVKHLPTAKHVEAGYQRWQATTAAAEHFEARSLGRLVIGLGRESVLETSLTLQFITGLPIIPGSALKGLCRHYALFTIAAAMGIKPLSSSQLHDRKEATPLQNLDVALAAVEWSSDLKAELESRNQVEAAEYFRAIFGSTDNGGACIFYDAVVSALPVSGTLFEVDVMTPHFVKYYNSANAGKTIEPPSDDDSPNPINFLTVAAGTHFAFAVGLRRGFDPLLAEKAATWLKAALWEMGIGAKTAVGYGVFEKAK